MKEKGAIALDIDGVVVGSPMPPVLKHLPSSSIAQGPLERVLLEIVKRRKIEPNVREQIIAIANIPIDIYGNTGRPNTESWVAATQKTLEDGGVWSYFKGILFKPEKLSSHVGKVRNIGKLLEDYDRITVVDDSPVEGLAIARAFPDRVRVLIVQSLTSGVLFTREDPTNVTRVASLGEFSPGEVLRYST